MKTPSLKVSEGIPSRRGEVKRAFREGMQLISESGAFDHGQVVTVILRRNQPSLHNGIPPVTSGLIGEMSRDDYT